MWCDKRKKHANNLTWVHCPVFITSWTLMHDIAHWLRYTASRGGKNHLKLRNISIEVDPGLVPESKATIRKCMNNQQTTSDLKICLDVLQSHPLCSTHFGQYHASSSVLGWPGNGDCYLMHRMQSDGWPYSKGGRDSLKVPSLHAAVLCAAVFRLKIVGSNRNHTRNFSELV